ncbi:hypothetical protein GGR53DRAFT_488793 [Hypoxylon sp. FL1150]|nr:hypothetical protein GGR53DRAFT_488793 [Hypoxylon sp. FL1150]
MYLAIIWHLVSGRYCISTCQANFLFRVQTFLMHRFGAGVATCELPPGGYRTIRLLVIYRIRKLLQLGLINRARPRHMQAGSSATWVFGWRQGIMPLDVPEIDWLPCSSLREVIRCWLPNKTNECRQELNGRFSCRNASWLTDDSDRTPPNLQPSRAVHRGNGRRNRSGVGRTRQLEED